MNNCGAFIVSLHESFRSTVRARVFIQWTCTLIQRKETYNG